jgi:glycolate oxidase iron-sulfur subunit
MQELRKLAKSLKALEEQLTGCMRCGMCQSVCPVFAQTLNEADVARGKLCLIDGLASEMLTDSEGVRERLDRCLLCGSCAANCPGGVSALKIFLTARVILTTYQGLSKIRQLIFRGLLSHPRLFDTVLESALRFQSLFIRPASEFLGTSCSVFTGKRHFMPFADVAFHKKQQHILPGKSDRTAAFFYGCLTDKVYPNIGDAALKALNYHGVGVFMPEHQACCGIPALSSGDMQTFKALVRCNLKSFGAGNFDALITPCATCTFTIRKLWNLFADEFSEEESAMIESLGAKTTDISAFIHTMVGVTCDVSRVKKSGRRRITYHDPCHLKKSLKISSAPRALIRYNENYDLVEMNEADYCCGCGGSFNLLHYDMSKQIGNRKRDNILASGAEVVATSCPACMMQISDMLSQHKDKISVRHAIEIYAESL